MSSQREFSPRSERLPATSKSERILYADLYPSSFDERTEGGHQLTVYLAPGLEPEMTEEGPRVEGLTYVLGATLCTSKTPDSPSEPRIWLWRLSATMIRQPILKPF